MSIGEAVMVCDTGVTAATGAAGAAGATAATAMVAKVTWLAAESRWPNV